MNAFEHGFRDEIEKIAIVGGLQGRRGALRGDSFGKGPVPLAFKQLSGSQQGHMSATKFPNEANPPQKNVISDAYHRYLPSGDKGSGGARPALAQALRGIRSGATKSPSEYADLTPKARGRVLLGGARDTGIKPIYEKVQEKRERERARKMREGSKSFTPAPRK